MSEVLLCTSAADIFALNSAPQNAQKELSVHASFFEIYSGKVYDLLRGKERLRILEDKWQQVQIVGLAEEEVWGVNDVLRLIQQGNKCRCVTHSIAVCSLHMWFLAMPPYDLQLHV